MASREKDKAIGGLLRRGLSREAGPGDTCPTPDILAAYYERSLAGDERARQELHFSHCGRCREQLAAMARAQEKQKSLQEWARVWDWRWLAPAAAVLAFLAVWVARRPAPTGTADRSARSPMVAMSEPAPESSPEKAPTASPSVAATTSQAETSTQAPPKKHLEKRSERIIAGEDKQAASEATPLAKESAAPSVAVEQRGGIILPDNENASSTRGALPATSIAAVKSAPVSPPAARPAPPAAEASDAIGESAVSAQEAASGKAESPPVAQIATREKGKLADNFSASLKTAEERSGMTLIPTPDAAVLWRIASAGFVERSDNGGAAWKGQLVDPHGRLVVGAAPSAKVCWLVGRGGAIFLTKDGKKWREIAPPEKVDFVGVTARNVSSATLTAADGRKFSTVNGGKSWEPAK
jgi:hypothetical protein